MIKDALVCLTASDEWYGKAIRGLTHSNVNHAFFAWKDPMFNYWKALQTDQRGVVGIPAHRVEYKYIECYQFDELDLCTALPWTINMAGDKYDWAGIAGFMVKLVAWRVAGRRIANPLHKTGELFCSEFVTSLLQKADDMYPQIMALKPSSVAPGGNPVYLGTPSLQYSLNEQREVSRVDCPWDHLHGYQK